MRKQTRWFSEFQIPQRHKLDIEQHCRTVHGEAVVHAFVLLVSAPAKLLGKALKKDSGTPSGFKQAETDGRITIS